MVEYGGEFKGLEGLYEKNRKEQAHCPCYPLIQKLMEDQDKIVADQRTLITEQVNKCFHSIIYIYLDFYC